MKLSEYVPRVNLLEDSVYILTKEDKFLLILSRYLRYILMVIELAVVVVFGTHMMYDFQIIKLKRSIESQVNYLKTLQSQESRIRFLSSFLDNIEAVNADRYSMYELNQKLLGLVGQYATIDTVTFVGKRATVTGTSTSYDKVAALERKLKSSTDIGADNINLMITERAGHSVSFEISLEFK